MTQLGKYEIMEELGRGGFGAVYKARDVSLERDVALKVLHPQLTVDVSFLDRFRKEARALAKVNHPNVVTIHEIGEVEGRVYIAMEYLPGGSLASRLTDGTLSLEETLKVTREICLGLQAGHTQGLIHRDVKPENILFNDRDEAVIADFGLAKAMQISSTTVASSYAGAVGTPYYRPPELWLEQPPTPATDIYSLACVVYEMLTGNKLFDGATPPGVMKKHFDPLERTLHLPEDLSTRFREPLAKALAKEPQNRFQETDEFLKSLEDRQFSSDSLGVNENNTRENLQTAESSKHKAREGFRQPLPKWLRYAVFGVVLLALVGVGLLAVLGGWQKPIRSEQDAPEQGQVGETIDRKLALATPERTRTSGLSLPEKELPEGEQEEPTPMKTTSIKRTPNEGLVIGSTMINERDGAEMVAVPAGEFLMGSEASEDEDPEHTVYLDGYWIYKYEVTNAQYRQCIEAGICGGGSSNYPQDNYPAVFINWYDAQAYCEWAGGRLPTEAEWEKAARGTDGRTYPWGEVSPNCTLTQFMQCSGEIVTVGKFPEGASPYGALDMAGNVWEWVGDWYGENYYEQLPRQNPIGPANGDGRVFRGGSWGSNENTLRISNRHRNNPNDVYHNIGFRCIFLPDF